MSSAASTVDDYDSALAHAVGDRLSRFAGALTVLIAVLTAVGEVVAMIDGRGPGLFSTPGGWAQVALLLTGAVVWAWGRCATPTAVRWLDAGLLLSLGVALPIVLWGAPPADSPDLIALLLLTLALLARAALVPSTPSTTVGVGLLAFAPTIVATARAFGSPWALGADPLAVIFGTVWAISAVGVAALCSHVVYDLRSRVASAMQLGPYSLVRPLGEGGMGQVFEAHHARLRRPAAIKLLRGDRISDRALERFEQEVQITATLRHPNTVSIYDYGRTATGTFFYVMELLDGMTLRELVDRHGPLSSARVAFLLEQMVGALAEAHEQGLLHRDVKPANVMVGTRAGLGDWVTVVDFGLAHPIVTEPSEGLSGTPLVLAPEVIRGGQVLDAAADLYAVGATAYFALTGTFPFEGETVADICAGHLMREVERPSERLGRAVDPRLEAIVLRCLAKDPGDRFEDCRALLADLSRVDLSERWTHDAARRWWSRRDPVPAPVAVTLTPPSRPECRFARVFAS